MKAFRFTLQPVHDARAAEEAQRRAELARAARAVAGARAELGHVQAAFACAARTFETGEPAIGQAVRAELGLLSEAVRAAAIRAEHAAAAQRAAQDAYIAARAARKQIEALRDRARIAFAAAAKRRDRALLDAANTAAHNAATVLARSHHI